MIVRIFQVEIYPDKIDDFRAFLLNDAMPMMRRQNGLVSITACLPHADTPERFALVMVWENEQAIAEFVGDNWKEPHIDPSEEGIVRDRKLMHYELAA